MAEQVDICNLALRRLGQESIESILDDSKAAILLNILWDLCLDDALRDHLWNFARRREQVEAEVDAPAWGYSYEYMLPGDCLRVVNLDDDPEIVYRVEGTSLLTDESSPINLNYIALVEDTTEWDAKFINAFAWRLAMEAAFPLTSSAKIVQFASQGYQMALSEAKAVDGQEDGPRDAGCDVWTNGRS